MISIFSNSNYATRIIAIVAIVIVAHLAVLIVRKLSRRLMIALPRSSFTKMRTISSQTGIVQSIGMRFLVLKNALGAQVFIPNRTITNVINYQRGYIRCLVDITLSRDKEMADQMIEVVTPITQAAFEQFPGIFITEPSIEGRFKTQSDKEFLRIKFRIWPGRGAVMETTIKQEILQALKSLDAAYADWMVTVNYEVETKAAEIGTKGEY